MAFEEFHGKYITDNDISMPQMEEYLRNSLYPMINIDKLSAKTFYYVEEPPNGKNAIGFHNSNAMFTIHVPISSFLLNQYEINTGKMDANTISFRVSGCRVDPVTAVTESGSSPNGQEAYNNFVNNTDYNTTNRSYLDQLSGITQKKQYLYSKYNASKDDAIENYVAERYNTIQQISLSLMFVNAPHVIYSSIELIKAEDVKEMKFGEVSKQNSKLMFTDKRPSFDKGDGDKIYGDTDTVYFDTNDRRQVWKISEYKDGYNYYYKLNKYGYYDSNFNYSQFDVVSKLGYDLQGEVKAIIEKAADARVVIASAVLSASNKSYMSSYKTRYINPTGFEKAQSEFATFYNKLFDDNYHAYTGFNLYGQETYGKTLGVVYLKVKGKDVGINGDDKEYWVNLNKYIISRLVENNISSNSEMLDRNLANIAFKPETYDLYNTCYQDNFWTQMETKFAQDKRRREIQSAAMKKTPHNVCTCSDKDIYNWTVSIGDVSFFVPPTSIRTISQTGTERLPVLRAKGSMARNIEKLVEQIELDLFFNNSEGINGIQTDEMPLWVNAAEKTDSITQRKATNAQNGTDTSSEEFPEGKVVYHMNGLRALYSEFRFTPFLPIVNKYINETLMISAVALEKITVSSVPGFPRLLKATLILKGFDYNVFMPEIPRPFYRRDEKGKITDEFVNPFSECINYDVLRYYIQKPILRGNFISSKLKTRDKSLYNANSIEYMKDTMYSGKSAFMNYNCINPTPNMDIYIANEDHLRKLRNIKRQALQKMLGGAVDNYIPTEIQEHAITDLSAIYETIQSIKSNPTIDVNSKIAETICALLRLTDVKGHPIIKYIRTDDGLAYAREVYDSESISDKLIVMAETAGAVGIATAIAGSLLSASVPWVLPVAVVSSAVISYETFEMTYSARKDKDAFPKQISIVLNEQYLKGPDDIRTAAEECFSKNSVYDDTKKARYSSYVLHDKVLPLGINGNNFVASTEVQKANWEFVEWCFNKGIGIVDSNAEAKAIKEDIDWDGVHSMVYDLLAKDVRIDSWQVSCDNHFAEVSLLGNIGAAMQYTGGSDIHVDFSLTTKNVTFVNSLKGLTNYEVYCMKNYHDTLPTFPIRIDSEFTRLFGIFEVSIEEVTVNTVPNYPGTYQINVRAISTDRSLRNKEALKSIGNADPSTKNGQSGEANAKGLTNKNLSSQVKFKEYDDLSKEMAIAELYPDLELPTIGELRKLGFAFLRYKEKERELDNLFVDPDFYFCYAHITVAEVLRRTIQTIYGEKGKDLDKSFKFSDLNGGQVEYEKNGINLDTANRAFNKDRKDAINKVSIEHAVNIEPGKIDFVRNIPALFGGDSGKWDISTKISANFMEQHYLNVLQLADKYRKFYTDIPSEERAAGAEDVVLIKKESDQLNNTIKFITENLDKSDAAADEIIKYLSENDVESANYYASNTINPKQIAGGSITRHFDDYESDTMSDYYNNLPIPKPLENLLDKLHIQSTGQRAFIETFSNLLIGSWVAWTAADEFNGDKSSTSWYGRTSNAGFLVDHQGSTVSAEENVMAVEESLANTHNGTTNLKIAGLFNIRKLTFSEIKPYLSESELKVLIEENDNYLSENGNERPAYYALDPFYRYKGEESINEYIKKCTKDFNFAAAAFVRIVFWWLAKLYKEHIFPSMSFDVFRGDAIISNKARERAISLIEKEFNTTVEIDPEFNKRVNEYIIKNATSIDSGKVFTAFVLALLNEPPEVSQIFNGIGSRNYDFLNNKIQQVTSPNFKSQGTANENDNLLRKFLLALCGLEEINAPEFIGRSNGVTPFSTQIARNNTKTAIAACYDPEKYIFHSYYDMICHDYRGRMLRAFPTFYCIFMDEGREVGMWKLHDNFYSVNAIYDITVAKSRKIASDTCTITLSNNYQTFTTDDEDGYVNYKGSFWNDIWENLVYKRRYAEKLEKQRLAANRVNRAKLQPGIRIHVRMGYGSDARELPCAFNGVIAEVQPGNQAVNIVAQGFGIELMNPILENDDADEIRYKDCPGFFPAYSRGGKPKQVLQSFLTTRGGALNKYVSGHYNQDQLFFDHGAGESVDEGIIPSIIGAGAEWARELLDSNPYNIYNFGDVNMTAIYPEGEIVQNLYEVSDLPTMALSGKDLEVKSGTSSTKVPEIAFRAQGKTLWDIAHICKSVAPEYITGIADFRFRSTLFFGKPHFYYAYDYITQNGQIIERRKPYEQYHYVNDSFDIIANNIKASSQEMRTVATGLYQHKMGQTTSNKDVGPLFVDKDIYPEYQKSMLVDTRLQMKSGAFRRGSDTDGFSGGWYPIDAFLNTRTGLDTIVGAGIDTVLGVGDFIIDSIDEKLTGNTFWNKEKKEIAWLATADSLKSSVKEMYQGSIVIVASPSIKPQDRLIIDDRYDDMSGQCLVRNVVHSLNPVTGMTSTIDIDCISMVDSREEMYKQNAIWKPIEHGMGIIGLCTSVLKLNAAGAKVMKESATVASAMNKLEGFAPIEWFKKTFGGTEEIKVALKAGKAVEAASTLQKIKSAGSTVLHVLAKTNPWIFGIEVACMVGSTIPKMLYWPVKNHQVLIVFPLKKNGMVYTAGLEGSQGLVYGSPTFKEGGVIETYIAEYMTPNPEDAWYAKLMKEVFLDEDLVNAAGQYNRNFKVFNNQSNGQNAISDEVLKQDMIESSSFGVRHNSVFSAPTNVTGLSACFNRATNLQKDENARKLASLALDPYYIDNLEKITKFNNRRAHLPIAEYTPLKKYMVQNNELFKIAHDSLNPQKDTRATSFFMSLEGRQLELKGKVVKEPRYITATDKNGNLRATGVMLGKESAVDIKVSDDLYFNGNAYVTINKNRPEFTEAEKKMASGYILSSLDSLGRARSAILNTNKVYNNDFRPSLSGIDLPGFEQRAYSFVTGGWLYNRAHLLAFSLSNITGVEPCGKQNLVTGTQFLNQSMNDMEKAVADYVSYTKNHVIYKAIPHYVGNDLVCRGIQLMAESVEDGGKFYFNRYYFNVQPGVKIDYATGFSSADASIGILEEEKSKANDLGIGTSDSNINSENDWKDVYDFPILQKEALIVLSGMLDYINTRLFRKNTSDSVQNKEDLKGTKVVLTSALRVNSNYKDQGAGFVFCLQGTGKLAKGALFELLKEYYHEEFRKLNDLKKFKSEYERGDSGIIDSEDSELPCFEIRKIQKGDEVMVKIRPVITIDMSKSITPNTTK